MTQNDTAPQGQNELLARIVECSHNAIFSVDNGLITSWNRGAERLYGYARQEVMGQPFLSLLWPSAAAEDEVYLYERLVAEESVTDIETEHVRKDGVQIAVRMSLSLLTDAHEKSLGAIITVHGISKKEEKQKLWDEMAEMRTFVRQAAFQQEERDSLQYRLEQLEVIDSHTGLTNRRVLDRHLENECQRAARYSMPLSFLMLYVDNLKRYRETRGVETGQTILRQVASLLQEEARTTDLVACYESELLCMVLPHTGREGAMMVAERIQQRVAAFYGSEQPVTVSLGVATFSHAMEDSRALVAEAENALSVAKQKGCNRAVHFDATRDYGLLPNGIATQRFVDGSDIEVSGQAVVRGGDASLLNISRKEMALAYETTIEGWANVLDLRDKEAEGHSRRVMEMTLCLAQRMGVSDQELVYMRWGALLHDIGKIGIPDSILFKPGPLTPEEWGVMRSHPTRAYEALAAIPFLNPALDIPMSHHENWNGTGYPQGLKGEEIPLAARIFAIVDTWDALRSNRPYRNAWTDQEALDHIYAQSGKQFDPTVTQAFHQMLMANNITSESDSGILAA